MGCGASTAAVAPADVVPPQPDAATDGASPLKKANTVPSTLGVNSPIGAPSPAPVRQSDSTASYNQSSSTKSGPPSNSDEDSFLGSMSKKSGKASTTPHAVISTQIYQAKVSDRQFAGAANTEEAEWGQRKPGVMSFNPRKPSAAKKPGISRSNTAQKRRGSTFQDEEDLLGEDPVDAAAKAAGAHRLSERRFSADSALGYVRLAGWSVLESQMQEEIEAKPETYSRRAVSSETGLARVRKMSGDLAASIAALNELDAGPSKGAEVLHKGEGLSDAEVTRAAATLPPSRPPSLDHRHSPSCARSRPSGSAA